MFAIQFRYNILVCPHCRSSLGHGYRRFGPAQIECYYCGKTVETGLTPWMELSSRQRRASAISEIIAPSYGRGTPWAGCALTVILFYFMPFINYLYLKSIIRESNNYSRSGKKPIWRGPSGEKPIEKGV